VLEALEDRTLPSAAGLWLPFSLSGPGNSPSGAWSAEAVQSDGKILVAGVISDGSGSRVGVLSRFDPNGVLDASFGDGGTIETPFMGDGALALDIAANGDIVVVGEAANGPATVSGSPPTAGSPAALSLVVVRFTPNGKLDARFGTDGEVPTLLPAGQGVSVGLTVEADGMILLADVLPGETTVMVASIESTGSLNAAFGSAGVATLSLGPDSDGSGQEAQGDKIDVRVNRNGVQISGLLMGFTSLGNATGPAASALQAPDGGFPAQVPWFQANQPGPPTARPLPTRFFAPAFPDYLSAALVSPTVLSDGTDLFPLASALPDPVPAAPMLSPSTAGLPAYLTSTEPGNGEYDVSAWSLPPLPSNASVQPSAAAKYELTTSFIAVPPGRDETLLVPWLREENRADSVTVTGVSLAQGAGEQESEQITAAFAGPNPQTSTNEERDRLHARDISWRPWVILLIGFLANNNRGSRETGTISPLLAQARSTGDDCLNRLNDCVTSGGQGSPKTRITTGLRRSSPSHVRGMVRSARWSIVCAAGPNQDHHCAKFAPCCHKLGASANNMVAAERGCSAGVVAACQHLCSRSVDTLLSSPACTLLRDAMAQIRPFEFKISKETQVCPYFKTAYFNSFLSMEGVGPSQNAKLSIALRVWLEEVTPNTPANDYIDWPNMLDVRDKKWYALERWPAGLYEHFRQIVQKQAQDFWSNQDPTFGNSGMCLMPVGDWDGLDWPPCNPTHRLNVDCDFTWVWATGKPDAHTMFYCVYPKSPPPPAVFQPTVFGSPGTATRTGVGLLTWECANRESWCSVQDLARITKGRWEPIMVRKIIPHEIGHTLGMPHIGVSVGTPECIASILGPDPDPNIDPCYYGSTQEDSKNIMSRFGSKVSFVNALPWLLRLNEHTHTSPKDWMICMGQRPPTPLSLLQK
jgi:uncharacterized delta-60 repeat protein